MDLTKCVTFGELGRLRDFSIVNLEWDNYVDRTISVSDNTLYALQSINDDFLYGSINFDVSGNKTFAYASLILMDSHADFFIKISVADREIYSIPAFDNSYLFLNIYDFIEVGDEYFWTATEYKKA